MVTDGAPDVQQVLAANLRRLRIARHLSLSELARATQMSKATLSGIESGRSNPTIETLAALAAALRVPLGELLEESRPGDVTVLRARAHPAEQVRDGLRRRPLEAFAAAGAGSLAELALDPSIIHEADPEAAGTRSHLYVIQGRVLAGPVERISELTPGDYASFPADVPYVFETGRSAARLLLLTTVQR